MKRIATAGHLIRRLHQQSTQVFQARTQAAGFDLTSVQFAALDAIARQPGIDQASLAAIISFDRATIAHDCGVNQPGQRGRLDYRLFVSGYGRRIFRGIDLR
jgi:hypothetical protein